MKKKDYLKEAQNFLNDKRKIVISSKQRNAEMYGRMFGAISETFGSMGIQQISIDGTTIDLKEQDQNYSIKNTKEEDLLIDKLNKGEELYAMYIGNDSCGYHGKENVLVGNQKIETLIDIDFINKNIPNAMIFDSKTVPWKNILYAPYLIICDNLNDFELLWNSINNWIKKDWHDNYFKNKKYSFSFDNVFTISYFHNFKPDLNWRLAKYNQSKQKLEMIKEHNHFAADNQASLKKSINFLLEVEDNPIFGSEITKMLEKLVPLLAKVMESKEILKEQESYTEEQRQHIYKGFESHCLEIRKPHDFPFKTKSLKNKP